MHSLNMAQERELYRLIEYERSVSKSGQHAAYRCAFPYRPGNELQMELVEARMLAVRDDRERGKIVVITSDGYSYFPEKERAEAEEERRSKRDSHLIGLTALFSALCMLAGFLVGFLLG